MAPLPVTGNAAIDAQLDQAATQHDVQHATAAISSSLRVVILILACLTVVTGSLYCVLRSRRGAKLVWPSTPLLVYESSVSIEFEEDEEEGTVVDVEEYDGRTSMETILSNGTPRRFTFDVSKVVPFLDRRRTGILDRRGKTTLQCDTTAYYETNILPTKTMSPIDRKVCRPKVHFLENIASPLSPFWSKQTTAGSPHYKQTLAYASKPIASSFGSPTVGQAKGHARLANLKEFWTP